MTLHVGVKPEMAGNKARLCRTCRTLCPSTLALRCFSGQMPPLSADLNFSYLEDSSVDGRDLILEV